ncbi:MAG: DUF1292 domain-containing protein [Erysipelothrix sp.]|nr:DUF1292 domain-containing protein [Erysipelothrix sp.]
MHENKIIVIDDNDKEIEMEILFTFESEELGREYVLYLNPEDESGEVFASAYTQDGDLLEISDEAEWKMIEEVFEAFVIKSEEEDED